MNNRDEHIIHSLRRWITGDVDQKEENQLDRQAREDSFLGEALEGYRQFPAGKHQERLERMLDQLPHHRQRGKKKGALLISLPYRITAAAAVLLAVGLFWWLQPTTALEFAEAPRNEDALATETIEAAPTMKRTDPAAGEQTPIENSTVFEEEPQVPQTTPIKEIADSAAGRSSVNSTNPQLSVAEVPPLAERQREIYTEEVGETLPYRQDPTTTRSLDAGTSNKKSINVEEGIPAPSTSSPGTPPTGFAVGEAKLQAPQSTRLVTGEVLDPSGTPLNGVLVVTPGDRTGTITNINGQYQILLDSNAQKLEFQRNGYSSQRVDIPNSQNFVRVTLDESASTMDQLMATEAKKERNRVNPSVEAAAVNLNVAKPENSIRRFKRYLKRNLNYPPAAIEAGITGSVTLTFVIQPDGRVVNVKAISGPSELRAEAIRLIEQGPAWEITNSGGKSINFNYRLDFSL